MDNERFAPLNMAGVEGQVAAILTDENLLLERSNGKGMRVELDSIARIRHHHVAVTPPLLTLFGVLALIASIRVFSGQVQIYSFILGVSSLLVWFLGRKPALCLDTKQGDRHILHGRDHLLQRMYVILDRMSDGCSLEDAVIGLEKSHTLELAPIGDIDEIRYEADSVAASQAQLDISNNEEQSLEQALAELQQGRTSIPIPSKIENESYNTNLPSVDSAYERVWGREKPQWYAEKDGAPTQSNMLERSTKALSGQRETTNVATTNYDAPFQLPSFESATSPSTTPANIPPMNRAQAAAKEASEANFDSGGLFGIFDQLDNDSATQLPPPTQIPVTPSSHTTALPNATQPSWRPSESSRTSSYSMITSAAGPNLPEPTRVALRTDLHTSPGLVASATIASDVATATPLPQKLGESFKKITKPNPLAAYPALNRMQKKYARDSRLRVNRSSHRRRSRAYKVIDKWVKPSLKRIGEKRQELGRKITGAGDGYRDVYGDEDGNQDDSYDEENFQTNQIIRLRADQDSQSEIHARLQLLTMNGGGEIAEDLANRTLRGISSSIESGPLCLSGQATKKLDTPSNFSGMIASTEPAPRFAGMKRLG
ncbi:MAG: hypothetical protein QF831_01845 [Candidatus Thalassarchaeaceae archaeon]|nr:hypothetical protein [Candidatus Thalassarchaeaceae archaeon]